jgi:Arc/MetJ-type ribon-helix-helix transcriptional regulator
MTNITTPLPKDYIESIDDYIEKGDFDSRSQFIRSAVKKLIEDREIEEILEASRRAKMGEVFRGDLKELAKIHG